MTIQSPPADSTTLQAFRAVPRTGVVFVTREATARGTRLGPGVVQPRPGIAGPLYGVGRRRSIQWRTWRSRAAVELMAPELVVPEDLAGPLRAMGVAVTFPVLLS